MVLKRGSFTYKAGEYVFLNIPSESLISHPFSIASDPEDEKLVLYIKDLGKYTHHLIESVAHNSSSENDIEKGNNDVNQTLIRVKDEGSNIKYVRLIGPYGNPSMNFHKYKVLLFIGAGVGCVPIYSLFSYLANHSTEKDEYKSVSLIWTFRGDCLYNEWKDDLKNIVANNNHFHIYLHCTKGNENLKDKTDFPITFSRPNIKNYLDDMKPECIKLKENKVGIYISGNDEIVDEVLKYSRKRNGNGFKYDIDNETFLF